MINKTSFSKMPSKRGFTLFLNFFLVAFAFIFLNGCSKNQFDAPSVVETPIAKPVSPQDLEVKEQFFKPIEGLNPIFQKIKDNLQNQDSTKNFVTAEWVAKHGVPAWDKIITGAGKSETSVQTRGSNAVHRLSFVPLKELRTNVIKSFIVVYHLDGSKFSYRLYNREALSVFVPSNDNDKRRIINMLAVFAYFEKNINDKVETYFPRPFDINLVNIDVKIGNAKNKAQLDNCIEILIYNQPIAYRQEWEIEIVCTDTGVFDWPASSSGGGEITSTVVFIDGSSAASSVATSMYSSLEPGGVPESVFLTQYPQYVTLFNNIKQLKLYLPDIDVTDLELFVVNPEIVTQLTTFLAQGGSMSDGVQHKSLLKENADYLAANQQAGFPQVNSIAYKAVVKSYVAQSIEKELKQLAINNPNLSNPGFQVFKNIIFKVLKKKVPDCIPGYGTIADLTEAYAAYQIGDYTKASINIATAIMDLVPPAKLLKLAVNTVDIYLTVQRVADPIIKLYNRLAGRFDNVFNSVFRTFDDLDIFDGIKISTEGSSILNIDVSLGGKSVHNVKDHIGGLLGGVWAVASNNSNLLLMNLGNGLEVKFNLVATSTDGPSIYIFYDGKDRIKIRFY